MANSSENVIHLFKQLGSLYGEMIQIHDNINDAMAIPANSDWLQGRRPLPILFAQSVEHPQQARFIELSQNTFKTEALLEAQEILIQCGSISYCVDQLLHRYQAAQKIMAGIHLQHPDELNILLEDIIAPVWKLLEAVQIDSAKLIISELGNYRA